MGDIQDEFDAEEASILKIDDTTFDVAGSVNITDFMEHFDLEEEYEEGFRERGRHHRRYLLGDLPEVGQTISYRNLDLEVTRPNAIVSNEYALFVTLEKKKDDE